MKLYKNKSKNQPLIIQRNGARLSFDCIGESHWERPRRERQEFQEITLLEIWNSNQESIISNWNKSSKHRKTTNQKRVNKV